MAVVTDIRVDASLIRSRKYKRTKVILGGETMEILISLWTTVALQRPSGILTNWDAFDVADAAGYTGDPEKLLAVLTEEKTRWIDMDDDGLMSIHDWEEHQAWVVKAEMRSKKARNAANARHSSNKQCNEHAPSMPAEEPKESGLGKVQEDVDLSTRLLQLHQKHFVVVNPAVPAKIAQWVADGRSFEEVENVYLETAESKRSTRWKWICEQVGRLKEKAKPEKADDLSSFLNGGLDEQQLGVQDCGADDQGVGAIELVQDAGSESFAVNH